MKFTQEQQEKSQELYRDLISRAHENESFKERLINEPLETIESFTGKKLDLIGNVKLIVEDQTNPDKIYLNIPRKLDLDNFELSDEQLEVVSGGEAVVMAIIGLCSLAVLSFGVGVALYNATK